jgi:hypothetical protein
VGANPWIKVFCVFFACSFMFSAYFYFLNRRVGSPPPSVIDRAVTFWVRRRPSFLSSRPRSSHRARLSNLLLQAPRRKRAFCRLCGGGRRPAAQRQGLSPGNAFSPLMSLSLSVELHVRRCDVVEGRGRGLALIFRSIPRV